MTLEDIIYIQEEFDSEHEGNFKWNGKITDENVELLEFLVVSITGEVGEVANIVKKIVRGDFTLGDKKSEIQEELADIFIYLIKMAYQLDINLEKAYINKMKKNKNRFERYEQSE